MNDYRETLQFALIGTQFCIERATLRVAAFHICSVKFKVSISANNLRDRADFCLKHFVMMLFLGLIIISLTSVLGVNNRNIHGKRTTLYFHSGNIENDLCSALNYELCQILNKKK